MSSAQPTSSVAPTQTSRIDSGLALLVFLVTFATYALTTCRTVYSGDSGDFVTAVATGGIPHPTGYPFFLLCARLLGTVLPIGEWAFRVNLFVAFTGAIAILFVFLFLNLLLEDKPVRRPSAILGAFTLAFGPTIWGQATISEIYSLNLGFLAALLFYLLRWIRTPKEDTRTADNRLAGLCFLYGLSITNHLTIVFAFPLFLICVIAHKPSLFGKQAYLLLPLAGLLVLPLALYAYLPWATLHTAAPNRWGMTDTFERLLYHLSGQRYSNYMFLGFEFFQFSLREYFGTLLKDELGFFLILAPIGLVALLRESQNRTQGLLLLGIWLVQTGYAINYATPDIDAYYMPGYLVLACYIGVGVSAVVGFVVKRLSELNRDRFLRLSTLILFLLPILPLTQHYGEADKSNDYRERDYALNLLRSCPPNSILILAQDTVFTLWYEQYVYKVRPDVLVIQYSLFTGSDIAYWYTQALQRAYPQFTPYLPVPNAPPTGDTGLIRLVEKGINAGHAILFLPNSRSYPIPTRTLQVAIAQEKKKKPSAEAASTSPAKTLTFNTWISTRSYALPYGLCVRLYPRFVSGKPSPPPILRDLVLTNAKIWESFDLNGVFVDHWRNDPDPLHYPMAAQYMESAKGFAQLAEEVGAIEVAGDFYQKSAIIYPTPEALAGLQRLKSHSKK